MDCLKLTVVVVK